MWPFNGLKNQARRAKRFIKAIYDSAQTTNDNMKHWANADSLSADAANNAGVRQTLRNRARYEIANNSYARGQVKTLSDDIVGTGPHIQILTDNAELNKRLEADFNRWAKTTKFGRKLRTMCKAKTGDGEALALLITNPKLPTKIKLDMKPFESDRLRTPFGLENNPRLVDGILYDEYDNPVSYYVLKSHPGGTRQTLEYDTIPAEFIIHWFVPERPEQHRGITEMATSLPIFAQLRRYTLAVLTAAENAAIFAMGLHTQAMADDESDDPDPMDVFELERNLVTVFPRGWDLTVTKPEQPTTTYPDFKREVLNEAGRGHSMPLNIMTCNSSGYNYASGRLDHQTYFKSIQVEQDGLENDVLDVVFKAYCNEAMLTTEFSALRTMDDVPHEWFYDGHEHIDPVKESNADETDLANDTTNLSIVYGRKGLDWETQLEQRIKEKAKKAELYKKYGIKEEPVEPSKKAISGKTNNAKKQYDDEESDDE